MSKVYWIDMRANMKKSNMTRLKELALKAGLDGAIKKNDITAIKIHLGEKDNVAFIRPLYVRELVRLLKSKGARPFLTDANTIYKGSRSDAVSHLETAIENGFNYAGVNAPVIIADGVRGQAKIVKEFTGLHYYTSVEIPEAVYSADSLLVLSHFKLHELTGFGGAMKNVGMGLATKQGKLSMHSNLLPQVKEKKCVGCRICGRWCPAAAIDYTNNKAIINKELCQGCGQCIASCPQGAVNLLWEATAAELQKKMMEQCFAMLHNKRGRVLFVNFCMDIVPQCDCYGYSDAPVIPDFGIFASTDPVALDRACVDLALKQKPLEQSDTILKDQEKKTDIFRWVYPEIDYQVQFDHAVTIGLGSPSYDLEKLELG